MNKQELTEHLQGELQELIDMIEIRCSQYDKPTKWEDIYAIDCNEYPVCDFDSEDLENHNFDLGAYYTIKRLLEYIKNSEQ